MRSSSVLAALAAVAFTLACSSSKKSEPAADAGVTQTIGAAGGTVSLAGGPTLAVPPGALAGDVAITVRRATTPAPGGALSELFEFAPTGQAFAVPISVAFPVPAGATAAAVYWTRPGSTTLYDRLTTALQGAVAVAPVNHFSLGYLGPAAPDAALRISGTVGGAWAEGVVVALSGGGLERTATTGSDGRYSFDGLPGAASYTLTPSLPGYLFEPPAADLPLSAVDLTQDFAARSELPAGRIGGVVLYAGAATGRIYVTARPTSCAACLEGEASGTSIPSPAAYPASFTIRGLAPGTYALWAYMDTEGTGRYTDSSPHATSPVAVTIGTGDGGSSAAPIQLVDPDVPAPAIANVRAQPGPGCAFVSWGRPRNAFGKEIASGYRVATGTDPAASSGPQVDVPAGGSPGLFHYGAGVTDGSTWYFRVAARVGAQLGSFSAPVAAQIGAPAGGSAASTSVAFPGITATGPLLVGFVQLSSSAGEPANIRLQRVDAPMSGATHEVAGVPDGPWTPFAILDQNGNGILDVGDVANGQYAPPPVAVPPAPGAVAAQTLSAGSAVVQALVGHYWDGASTRFYTLDLSVRPGVKLPVRVLAWAGKGLRLPRDLGDESEFWTPVAAGSTAPTPGDVYRLRLTFSDGSEEDVAATVTIPGAFAQDLSENTAAPYSRLLPLLQWSAPATPPARYRYTLSARSAAGPNLWSPRQPLPASWSSTVYGFDGGAPPLTTGSEIFWMVHVEDDDGNQAVLAKSYTP